jgi:hypothetical protein
VVSGPPLAERTARGKTAPISIAMPITPFHFGPGLFFKAAGGRHISLSVFCLAQVVTDAEVVLALATGGLPLHGPLHTYAGAAGVAVVGAVAGRPLCIRLKRVWNVRLAPDLRGRLTVSEPISFSAAAVGAAAGSFSHVFLDSFMHPDMAPLAPLSATNHLLNGMSLIGLHLLCALMGVAGAFWMAVRTRRDKRTSPGTKTG